MTRLARLTANPLVVLLSRAVAALGLALASGAVWIFLDTRQQQKEQFDQIAQELHGVNKNLSDLKMDMAVGNIRLNETRNRLKRIEDKVFQ